MSLDWKRVKTAVARVAPVLGAAINPAIGGAAGTLIAAALGTEEDPAAIEAAINADPEAALKLRELQARHTEALERLEVEKLSVELKDTQHARDSHKLSDMPAFIWAALTIIIGAALAAILQYPVPDENRDVVYVLLGNISTAWLSSIAYWVGTTRSSAEKTRLLK